MTLPDIDPTEFGILRNFARQCCGVVLSGEADHNVIRRVRAVLRQSDADSISALLRLVDTDDIDDHIGNLLIDAITTHETSFFRDEWPFTTIQDTLLPELLKRRRGTEQIRIWSAACSTGQEPYSLAMLITDHFPQLAIQNQVEIFATDVSTVSVDSARAGIYSAFDWGRSGRPHTTERYRCATGEGGGVDPVLRKMVRFETFNLLDSPERLGTFDLVLLRNVCIYFSPDERRAILARIHRVMAPGGHLLLGSSESMDPSAVMFDRHSHGNGVTTYRPSEDPTGLRPR